MEAQWIGANIAQSPREITDALNMTSIFDPGGLQRRLLLGSDTVGEEALIRPSRPVASGDRGRRHLHTVVGRAMKQPTRREFLALTSDS
jgi:hypothetical protein